MELLPGGSSLPVTEDNKMQYLDLLAQYRLATSVQDEIEAFLKGKLKWKQFYFFLFHGMVSNRQYNIPVEYIN